MYFILMYFLMCFFLYIYEYHELDLAGAAFRQKR